MIHTRVERAAWKSALDRVLVELRKATELAEEGESLAISKIVLLGIEEEAAAELIAALPRDRFQVSRIAAHRAADAGILKPDLICLPAEPARNRPMINALRKNGTRAPFVVVSRNPSPQEWLAAVQQGAVDYLEPPFAGQLQWKVLAALRSSPMNAFMSLRPAVTA